MKSLGMLALVVMASMPGHASACRLALALGLDVSGSVDGGEYRLQIAGVSQALGDPGVEAALFAMPDAPVALAVFEWSSSRYQRIIQDWVVITDKSTLDAVRARLLGWQRAPAPEATGLGAAMQYGHELLARAPACWDRTLDVSGDGKNNDWPSPELARARGVLAGITINGLAIAEGLPPGASALSLEADDLPAYFRARVIQGDDAFVEVAHGFANYADAMRRKLLRELKTIAVGELPLPAPAEVRRVGLNLRSGDQ